jgi:hypothetical protein
MTAHQAPHTTHRWLVDRIEDDVASIVGDGARRFRVPCSLLPDGVREGHVLDVVREESGSAGVRFAITIDAAATAAARSATQADAAHMIVLTGRRDEGGDVVL